MYTYNIIALPPNGKIDKIINIIYWRTTPCIVRNRNVKTRNRLLKSLLIKIEIIPIHLII